MNTYYKNSVQRKLVETLADWEPHLMDDLVRETGASGVQALRIQIGNLRKKIRKLDRDILYQEGLGYRMVSLIPHPSHLAESK